MMNKLFKEVPALMPGPLFLLSPVKTPVLPAKPRFIPNTIIKELLRFIVLCYKSKHYDQRNHYSSYQTDE